MSNTETAAIKRQLKIKSGVVQRLYKERISYTKEEEDQKHKLDKFIAVGAEDWDIKNARLMLEESRKMIKDTSGRLETAVRDLTGLVTEAKGHPTLIDDEDLKKAEGVLEGASV